VNLVAMEQRRDAVTVGRGRRDVQDQLAVPERLVVDRQGVLVVADLLEGSHNAGAQSVVAAVRIQDACSLLTAQDFRLFVMKPIMASGEATLDGLKIRVVAARRRRTTLVP
jgi:hypothetical protein